MASSRTRGADRADHVVRDGNGEVRVLIVDARALEEIAGATRRPQDGETLVPLEQIVELLRVARCEEDRRRETSARFAQLTRREREVLQLLADGLSGEQIAARLVISPSTQRNHVANILAKLDVHSQLQAVVFALRNDVIALHPAGAGPNAPAEADAWAR